MPERPIIFSGPMVRAILGGQKTQTRRLFRLPRGTAWYNSGALRGEETGDIHDLNGPGWCTIDELSCPHGRPGDRLWVREAHMDLGACVLYRADRGAEAERAVVAPRQGWASPIHMPRCASRITLEVTGVRVERLQDVSAADCWAEGIEHSPDVDPVHEYSDLWRSIYGPGSWAANPWVWVVEFQRVDSEARQP